MFNFLVSLFLLICLTPIILIFGIVFAGISVAQRMGQLTRSDNHDKDF